MTPFKKSFQDWRLPICQQITYLSEFLAWFSRQRVCEYSSRRFIRYSYCSIVCILTICLTDKLITKKTCYYLLSMQINSISKQSLSKFRSFNNSHTLVAASISYVLYCLQVSLLITLLLDMEPKKFDIEFVIKTLGVLLKEFNEIKQISFDGFCQVLDEYCYVFKELNSFLGIAFSDVKEKVTTIRANNQIYPNHKGFFSFIRMEIQKSIHTYNGSNNGKLKAPKQLAKYSSTSRNLLRMMWLLTFIRVTFEECRDKPLQKLSVTFDKAYDKAFGQKHSWLVRKGAKIAIMASSDRSRLVQVVMGNPDQAVFQQANNRFLNNLVPLHDALWEFYKQHKLGDLE